MRFRCTYLFLLFCLRAPAGALEVRFEPAEPTMQDQIAIEISGCVQEGTVHWGVNADGIRWEAPADAYLPAGSTREGVAVRTPLQGPDDQGICRVVVGPFQGDTQLVRSVSFAIQWKDGTWSNKDEKNYNIKVSYGRITWTPRNPTVNDRIVVQIHRSPGAGQLRWGVNAEKGLWLPPISNYWPKGTVLADDRIAVDTPISRPDRQGISTITLGPFHRPDQVVRSLHMAVHWDGVWDTDAARNYNTELMLENGEGCPHVRFETPADGDILVHTPQVTMQAEFADEVDMWLNGRIVAMIKEAPFELRIPFQTLGYGRHTLTARAAREGLVGLEQISFWKVPPHVVEGVPEGTPLGCTVHGDGTATFALYAPGKKFVSLVGDFNQWDRWVDMMKASPDGTWWLRRPVGQGVQQYQYCIEGLATLADPWSKDLSWKDRRGREGYRPEDARTVVDVGASPFVWTSEGYQRPALDQMVIYELHIDDMCPGQGFTGLIARLDYIQDLGCNAIEPMPVTEFPQDHSWGYNPAYHLAPESSYGTPEELKRLIDACHARGMAFIFDVVLNHMDGNSALYQLYGSDYDASPYFQLFLGDNWGFPDLKQSSPAFKRYAADAIQHWIREYRVDGYRYDATRWVGWDGYNNWGAGWFAYAARQADPGNLQIAEHLPTDPELIRNTEMDSCWHDFFHWRIKEMIRDGYLNRDEFARIMDPTRDGYAAPTERMAYVESHDEERMVWILTEAGYKRDEVMRRAETGLALTLTAPGPAMIYSGQEFGEDTRKRVGSNPLNWGKLRKPDGRMLHQRTRSLVRLRTSHPALRFGPVEIQDENVPQDVAVYRRTHGEDSVVVAANFGRTPRTVVVDLPFDGRWLDVLRGQELAALGSKSAVLKLEPGATTVLTRVL